MKNISIGREPDNNVIVNDPTVSRHHCIIFQDDSGRLHLVDTNSTNGTYVNGKRCNYKILLHGDAVRIGNFFLPWETYYMPHAVKPGSHASQVPKYHQPSSDVPNYYDEDDDMQTKAKTQNGIGILALLISIIGAGMLLYCAILIMKWGILAWIGSASTYVLVSVGINILAYIIALPSSAGKDEDNRAAVVAKGISGFCIGAVVAFFLYWKFVDPNMMNPFRNF